MNAAEPLKTRLVALLEKYDLDSNHQAFVDLRKEAELIGIEEKQWNQILKECVNLVQWRRRRKAKEIVEAIPELIEAIPETYVYVLEEKVSSLTQLGQVLFENPLKSLTYLADEASFKSAITVLYNNDVNKIFRLLKLLKSEPDKDKKFLKVIYYLNPELPYRTSGNVSANIRDLLYKSYQQYDWYAEVCEDFEKGKIQCWLQAINAPETEYLNDDSNYISFLSFVYSVDANYPYYLNEELLLAPDQLLEKAGKDKSFFDLIREPINREGLTIWLNARENADGVNSENGDQSQPQGALLDKGNSSVAMLKAILTDTAEQSPELVSMPAIDLNEPVHKAINIDPASDMSETFANLPADFEKDLEQKVLSARKVPLFANITKFFKGFENRNSTTLLTSLTISAILIILLGLYYYTRLNQKSNIAKNGNDTKGNMQIVKQEGSSNTSLTALSSKLYSSGNRLYQQKKYAEAYAAYNKSDSILANDKSECMIGTLYYMGQGVTQSDSIALIWYLNSAKSENPVAIYSLGLLYANGGKGVKKDIIKAYQYLSWVVENSKEENLKNSAKEKLRLINE